MCHFWSELKAEKIHVPNLQTLVRSAFDAIKSSCNAGSDAPPQGRADEDTLSTGRTAGTVQKNEK